MMGLASFCNGVIPFAWDRLPLADTFDNVGRTPCLAEDHFVEDALAAGSEFIWRGRDADTSHRMLFRYARAKAWERGEYGSQPHWLLLHQQIELLPVLFAAAATIHARQGDSA